MRETTILITNYKNEYPDGSYMLIAGGLMLNSLLIKNLGNIKAKMCVKMVGLNWVKKNQLIGWCSNSLPIKSIVSFNSIISQSVHSEKQLVFYFNWLWINLSEICFPQKYIIKSMNSGGIRSAILQFLFSSKSRPKPAEFTFSRMGLVRTYLSADGLPLILPCTIQGVRIQKR